MKKFSGTMETSICEICGKPVSASHAKCSSLKAIKYGSSGENRKPKKRMGAKSAEFIGRLMDGR